MMMPRAASSCVASRLTSSPLNSTWPCALTSRVMARSSVVFPAPFGPSTVTSSPSATVRLVGLSAATRP